MIAFQRVIFARVRERVRMTVRARVRVCEGVGAAFYNVNTKCRVSGVDGYGKRAVPPRARLIMRHTRRPRRSRRFPVR